MSWRYALVLLSLPLALVGCRPQQAQLDEIQKKLAELAQSQAQLEQNVNTAPPAPREGSGLSRGDYARLMEWHAELLGELQGIREHLDELEREMQAAPAVAVADRPKTPRPGRPDPASRYRVDIGNSHVQGPANALITIVAFTDYQCPFCKRVQPTVEAIQKKYKREVRLVHKHNPLPMHNRAMAAALAAEAAGKQGKFWKMHELLWTDIRMLTDERFEQFAVELGLNIRRFNKDRSSADLEKRIKAEQKQGQKVGARGTPAFFINGRFLSGAQPQDAFERVIKEELDTARDLVKRGTKKSRVYKKLMSSAKTKV